VQHRDRRGRLLALGVEVSRSGFLLRDQRSRLREKTGLFVTTSCVCPEPVLANAQLLAWMKWNRKKKGTVAPPPPSGVRMQSAWL
jgi:hypothetical protein